MSGGNSQQVIGHVWWKQLTGRWSCLVETVNRFWSCLVETVNRSLVMSDGNS